MGYLLPTVETSLINTPLSCLVFTPLTPLLFLRTTSPSKPPARKPLSQVLLWGKTLAFIIFRYPLLYFIGKLYSTLAFQDLGRDSCTDFIHSCN